MLILSRKLNEEISIGDNVRVVIVKIEGADHNATVKLGIDAPREVAVLRKEAKMRTPAWQPHHD